MSLNKALQKLKFDKRMVNYNVGTKFIKYDDYEKHLKELPDIGDQSETFDIQLNEKPREISNDEMNGSYHS